ncbi:hypothetical protein MSG28_003910 [Choristoneura fumiferana]|uniref:Uncharacterized protein n=1 Tax=Choristoneura fumiferana TaxID=7141 RepID=A0ACC0KHE3_CHOFU|nr:hypothetical protein MSG28_003910 [Choristoneura fumiferana]
MRVILCLLLHCLYVTCEIRQSVLVNKLVKIKPVGKNVQRNFVPLTEIPPPKKPHVHVDGRRHFEDCSPKPHGADVVEGGTVDIWGEYYDEKVAKTVATVIIPDHIDRKHFEVTTQVPYLTLGAIEAIGYHPSTLESDHPPECEKIYQEHIADQYSDETTDYSEESLEMARMPMFPVERPSPEDQKRIDQFYSDEAH